MLGPELGPESNFKMYKLQKGMPGGWTHDFRLQFPWCPWQLTSHSKDYPWCYTACADPCYT